MERWLAACWETVRSQAARLCPHGRWLLWRLQVSELDMKAQQVRATVLTCGAEQVGLRADKLQTVLVDGALDGGTLGDGALAGGALVPTRTTADVAPADCGAGREGTVCPCYWTNFWHRAGGAARQRAAGASGEGSPGRSGGLEEIALVLFVVPCVSCLTTLLMTPAHSIRSADDGRLQFGRALSNPADDRRLLLLVALALCPPTDDGRALYAPANCWLLLLLAAPARHAPVNDWGALRAPANDW